MHGTDLASPATPERANPVRRVAGGRRMLPTGRAVVGGLLVTLAAVVVFAAWSGTGTTSTTAVVVASHELTPGQRLEADDLELRSLEIPAELAGGAFADVEQLIGSTTLGPVGAGELVQKGQVALGEAPDGLEFSFAVDSDNALAGTVRAGEVVDLLATYDSGGDARTELLAGEARVLRVRDAGSSTLGSTGRLVLTVSLESDDEVLAVAHAAQVAVITLVRGGSDSGTEPGRQSDDGIDAARETQAAPLPGAGS